MNLIVDLNNFALRSLFTYKEKGEDLIKDAIDASDFVEKFLRDLQNLYNTYNKIGIDNIVFCGDSSSWRKKFQTEYKAKRVSSTKVNWDNFFGEVLPKINEKLSKYSIIHKMTKLEADDLILYWVDYFRGLKQDSIILSSDRDLDQLIYKDDDSWCVKINLMHKKIYCTPEFKDWIHKEKEVESDKSQGLDFLFSAPSINKPYDLSKEFFSDMLNIYTLEPVDVNRFLLEKIITGDAGDNVKSIYVVNNRGIGEKGAQTYVNRFPDFVALDLLDEEFIDKLAETIFIDKKAKLSKKEITDNANKNVNLMYLNKQILDNNLEGISDSINHEIRLLAENFQTEPITNTSFIDLYMSINLNPDNFNIKEI